MPHLRKRLLTPLIAKKLKRMPIVLVNGARQTGKSFMMQELLSPNAKAMRYETLDETAHVSRAKRNPSLFLTRKSDRECLVVDEAQKVPQLFDQAKAIVDKNRRPGQYVFLGSTEFSHRTKVRESLTGRATRATLYPLTLAETQSEHLDNLDLEKRLLGKQRFKFQTLETYLERGGLPAIFAIRNDYERTNSLKDWLELTLNRDLRQIPDFKADPVLGRSILESIATQPDLSIPDIAKQLGASKHRVNKHMEAFRALFVINAVPKMPRSYGSENYFICDVALAKLLGARFETCLRTWVALEIFAFLSYSESIDPLFTYRSERGATIDFVLQTSPGKFIAIKIYPFEVLDGRDFEVLRVFKQSHPDSKVFALLPPSVDIPMPKGVQSASWNTLG